jgi:photosystem II stability/assembly factor-like uncharacterized protein
MRKCILVASFFLLATSLLAQTIDLSKQAKNLKARSIGPAGMSGRVTAIDAVLSNPNIIYIGAASGGVWKTESGGASWKPVFDDQPTQNIGAVAIQQSNPSVVWVGTGEGNPRNSINIGEGIFKSLDGGISWKRMGLEKTRNIHRIIIDPVNPNTVYVAAIGNPYAFHAERGVYKTTNGGESWERILYTNDSSGCAELVIDPSNPNKLIANMWQHYRTPWSFHSGGAGGGMYMTWDGGKNWKKLGKSEGIPDSIGRVGLAISYNEPKVMYALVEAPKNALYRNEDGGFKWTKTTENPDWVTNRPFYFQDIRIDPKNENRLYSINQRVWMSEDGGKTFTMIVPYSGVHPDHHALWIHPDDPSFIIDGNDGGISISHDRARTWQFDEKLPLGQFYHIAVDNEIPYHVMGGMQDNGSWRGPAYVWSEGGLRNYFWKGIGGGDGFDVSPDPDDASWVYSMSQGGALQRFNSGTGETWGIRPPMHDTAVRIRFNWNAAFAQDPFDHNTIYYGSQFVHKSLNKGAVWSIISPDLTTNNPEKQKQDENGGLTIDITNAENHCTILAIEPSPLEKGLLWVGTDDGQVQLTRDGGNSWSNITPNIKGFPPFCWIQQIRASRYQAGEVFVVANNYRLGDFGVYIFRSSDYGKTWTRMVDDKKVRGYALSLIQDPVQPNLLFVGTENGLWISFDNGNSFQQFKNDFPPVSTYDLAIQEREADLLVGTFGRALYVIDNIRPLRELAATKGVLPKSTGKALRLFSSPLAYENFTNAPAGIEWSSWGVYAATNRPNGAQVNYYLSYPSQADTSKSKTTKPDSVLVKIFNKEGKAIRTFKAQADSGFNRIYWDFKTAGVRKPGDPKPKKDAPEPVGDLKVAPGEYKVVVGLLGKDAAIKDSTTITVAYDPRSKFPADAYRAQVQMNERLDKISNQLTAALDQLSDDEASIAKVEAQLKDVETPAADSLRKMGKAVQDSIKNIRDDIAGKKQEKQGYGTAYQLTATTRLKETRDMINEKTAIPGPQEEREIAVVDDLAKKAIAKVQAFQNGAWIKYRKLVETTALPIFSEPVK